MVLQRDQPINIWGTHQSGEAVKVSLGPKKASTKTDDQGNWIVTLESLPAGGPYTLKVSGDTEITMTNILIGDVWVCSGQSNMEWPLWNTENAEEEIARADFPQIRHIKVPRNTSTIPLDEIEPASWQVCSPETASDFTAVGYYFAKALCQEVDVPIGLLNTSWGGTNVETWIPLSKMQSMVDFESSAAMMERADEIDQLLAEQQQKLMEKVGEIPSSDAGNTSGKFEWKDADISSWSSTTVPGLWETAGLPNFDGIVWYGKEFELSEEDLKKSITLNLGPIDDSDKTFLNGQIVGEMTQKYNENRKYIVDPAALKVGTNKLVVRVDDTGGGGGFWGSEGELYIQTGSNKIALAGEWKRKIGAGTMNTSIGPNDLPNLLYNAMIHPLIKMNIKGAIWYQGESNAGRSKQYNQSFPAMIESWRDAWNMPNMPFYFVQLANFLAPSETPEEHGWAELREAQMNTLELSNTGMAVIIDIGEADDIHPRNKLDVGRRLALNALNKDYGQSDRIFSGPLYRSHRIKDGKVIISFDHTGSGLMVKNKYGYLQGFALAGVDKKFYWAKGIVRDNQVIVHTPEVPDPVAIRYAWAANPDDANLYNKEGLPASPFRTDDWKGVTDENKYEPSFKFE